MSHGKRGQLFEEYGITLNPDSPEPFFKQTLQLAANICNAPIAYINILGDEKQYIISQYGSDFQTIAKEESIFQFTIEGEDVLVIPDTLKDERTRSLKLAQGEKGVRFYAGFPLVDLNQNNLGALCVTDYSASKLDQKQKENLKILGKQVVEFLNIRKETMDTLHQNGQSQYEKSNLVKHLNQKLNSSSIQLSSSNSKLKAAIYDFKIKNQALNTLTNEFPGTVSIINKEYKYIFNNKKYEELSDFTQDEIIGKHVREIVGQTVFESLKPMYDRVLNGERINVERFFEFKNGKRFLEVNYIPYYNDTQIIGVYVFSKDLTDIKSYQSQLEHSNEKLESFAHIVCHDLQSPMRTITSFIALLQKDLKKRKIEYKQEYMDFIIQSTKQSSKLISDLLEFAKVGKGDLIMQKISLVEVCDNVLLNLFELIQKEGAQVSLPETDVMLFGFKTDFVILFQNFISNAIKYRHSERSPQIEIRTSMKENNIEISILDNGLGIPANKIDEIFKPFKRLAEYSHIEGTGIGLATCKKILKKYDSSVKVQSKYGDGTCFSFQIPKG